MPKVQPQESSNQLTISSPQFSIPMMMMMMMTMTMTMKIYNQGDDGGDSDISDNDYHDIDPAQEPW